jgi:hypothetical protein
MHTFAVESIAIDAPRREIFECIADPQRLPDWTAAFKSVNGRSAVMTTPRGTVEIGLDVESSPDRGTVDWKMTFPDGTAAYAWSRVIALGPDQSVYTFLLPAPPVPLEELEGTLAEQRRTLRHELANLAARWRSNR